MREALKLAGRMDHITASGIRKVFDLGAKLTDPINLSIGMPDFDVPQPIKDEAIAAIQRGENRYTPTQGTDALRGAVAEACAEEFGWGDERSYMVTSGVAGALTLAITATVDPGDEVIVTDPHFVMYTYLTRMAGGVPVPVDTYDDFRPDLNRIAEAVTDKTRLIVINSPGNPTGCVYTEDELRGIADIAETNGLLVLSDEIYDLFCYDGSYASMARYYENTIMMRGFSKAYGMPGWRMGWCSGPDIILDKMKTLQQWTFVCAPSMAQAAGVVALKTDMSDQIDAYRHKRDMVADALCERFGWVKQSGAFYAFVPAPGGNATEFVTKAIASNVLIIPGSVFSSKDTHFRISYAAPDEKLAEGLDILVKLADEF
ncbi:MAG: pyridoxal phosphate-dependent aminotransferase [Planctomycetota bacterium]|jgi:aspartate aminotransferase/aminotransferase